MKTLTRACLLMALSTLATLAGAQTARPKAPSPPPTHEQDVEAVRKTIAAMGEAFNARDPQALMSFHAKDVILTDPGIPDQSYEALTRSYAELSKLRPGMTITTTPRIEEILLSGDLAVVRVVWTTVTTETAPVRKSTRFMKGLQVWRREEDGSWKFARGMNFRTAPPGQERKPLPS